ncbi:hypothetical protein BLA29_011599 [Euroglyphus maynei]|uniref:Protein FMC1 homolog n=1 Tax=Euroglyphus maynei TaxID=6958 RepID=A0A1Y3B983_EURMA|nr:hypothetical protein BLA29_011599 [Euroglyphus maynei]
MASSNQLRNETLCLVRSICRTLRTQMKGKVSESPMFEVIRQTVRQNKVTDQRICRAPNELRYLGETYRTYLDSGEKYRQLLNKYYGKSERSVEQTAEMMGFKLPEKH